MIDYSQILNNNSDNENLYNIYNDSSENLPFFQNNEGYSTYLENNLKTDFNSKSQFSNQNNNPCLNDLSNTLNFQTDNIFDKEENEVINKDNLYFIKEIFHEDKKIEKKIFKAEKILMKNNLNKNNLIEENKNENDKQKIFGRKKLDSDEKGLHNKKSKDNIVNKIKAYFFNSFIRNLIKEYAINKSIELKKLPTIGFISDLSKKNNEKLFNVKISEILREQPISTKYSTFKNFENKKIIDKIYNENKEKNVIKILELTFEELLIIYRISLNASEDMEKLEEIKNKIDGLDLLEEKNKCKGIENLIEELKPNHEDEYIEVVKTVCLEYKKWFNKKKERKHN